MKATRANSQLVNFLLPTPILQIVDDQSDREDVNRAKWIRDAIREKIERDIPTSGLALGGAR